MTIDQRPEIADTKQRLGDWEIDTIVGKGNNEQQIKEIQYKINNRPRKNLNFYSPKENFFRYLQNKEKILRDNATCRCL